MVDNYRTQLCRPLRKKRRLYFPFVCADNIAYNDTDSQYNHITPKYRLCWFLLLLGFFNLKRTEIWELGCSKIQISVGILKVLPFFAGGEGGGRVRWWCCRKQTPILWLLFCFLLWERVWPLASWVWYYNFCSQAFVFVIFSFLHSSLVS